MALLALLFAERDAAAPSAAAAAPLMLLDDVMSELDAERRELLAELLRDGGQAVVTATEADARAGRRRRRPVAVEGGRIRGPRGAAGGMRRLAPAAAAPALAGRSSPARGPPTPARRASRRPGRRWPGAALAAAATPVAEREGVVTVACESSRLGARAGAPRSAIFWPA